MNPSNKLVEAIRNAHNIVIISHVAPDGDTLGSMLALKEMIDLFDPTKRVDAVILGRIPDVYRFLPGIEEVKNPSEEVHYQSYHLAIAVDCASVDRMGEATELFRNAKNTAIIDHHVSNNGFGKINWIESTAASTGQILYKLAEKLKVPVTKTMALNIYTSIVTDTGGFKFGNTSPETHEIAARLLEVGVNPSEVFKNCYESKPIAMVKLQASCVVDAFYADENKIAYSFVSRQLMQDLGATDDHVDGVSEALRQIDTVEVSMVLKETPRGSTKISLRSNRIDVSLIAAFFGGGGHSLASGCTIEKNLNDSLNEILPIIQKQIRK